MFYIIHQTLLPYMDFHFLKLCGACHVYLLWFFAWFFFFLNEDITETNSDVYLIVTDLDNSVYCCVYCLEI